jgi:hypothetical protein
MPCTNHAQNVELNTSSCYILCAHCKTIDCRVGKWWNELGCNNVLSHNSPRHRPAIDKNWRDWFTSTDDDFLCFDERNHIADGIATDMVAGS